MKSQVLPSNFLRGNFFPLQDPFGLSIDMRYLYQFLTLAPAPLFLAGAIYSVLHTPAMCGAFPYEMALMWFVMTLAHVTPWILFFQQRNLARD
jgi:hypothetical protein